MTVPVGSGAVTSGRGRERAGGAAELSRSGDDGAASLCRIAIAWTSAPRLAEGRPAPPASSCRSSSRYAWRAAAGAPAAARRRINE